MIISREMTDKNMMLDALKQCLQQPISCVYNSGIPPLSDRQLQKHTQPWFRLAMSLDCVYDPGCYYENKVKRIRLTENDILLVQSGGYLTGGSTEAGNLQIIFRDQYIRYLYSDSGVNNWWHTANPASLWVKNTIQSLNRLPFSQEYEEIRRCLAEVLLRSAVLELEQDHSEARGKAYATYCDAVEYMVTNLSESIERRHVAKACGVTESHISRLFDYFSDADYKDALKKMRLERALPLLRDHSYALDAIADLCGFKSATHFIRVFKHFHGCTPGQYRNRG